MPIPLYRRPGTDTSLGDHEKRLRALERNGDLSHHLRFNVDNVGDWLEIQTSVTGPAGAGIVLSDTSGGAVGIDINSVAPIQIIAGEITLGTSVVSIISGPSGGVGIANVPTVAIDLTAPTGFNSGWKFRIVEGLNTLLEVRDDDTFHMLTGSVWVADL